MSFTLRCRHPLVLFNLIVHCTNEKVQNPAEEMSEKKRLQGLVWDGLFNSLEVKPVEDKNSSPPKKEKKDKKTGNNKDKPEDNQNTE
jgi:hypothetical protein